MPHSSAVTAGIDIAISHHNDLRKDVLLGARIAEAKAGAPIVTLDLSDVTKGNIKNVTLDQNVTVRFSGITVYPTLFFVRFIQNSSGGFAVTIDENVRYPGKTQAAVDTGANNVTAFMFIANAANDYDCYYAGFGLGFPE